MKILIFNIGVRTTHTAMTGNGSGTVTGEVYTVEVYETKFADASQFELE